MHIRLIKNYNYELLNHRITGMMRQFHVLKHLTIKMKY